MPRRRPRAPAPRASLDGMEYRGRARGWCDVAKESGRRGRRPGVALGAALLVAAVAVVVASLGGPAWDAATAPADDATAGLASGGGIDWDALRATNPDVVAWVRVDGTPIDRPVLQSSGDEPSDWYLTHGLDGSYSSEGSAFLDERASADSGARLVFGHHMGDTGLVFSSVAKAYRQDAFDSLGEMWWGTPDGGALTLRPVMAMSVDASYAPIQRFGFATEGELREWLCGLMGDATATSADAEDVIGSATDVVTLCTCSSDRSGRRARTLVVFAG